MVLSPPLCFSATVTNDTLLLQPLAAVLEILTLVTVHSADLGIFRQRLLLDWLGARRSTHVVVGLVAHRLAASQSLRFQQVALSAVHADAVIWLEVPAARALFVGNGASEETKGEEQGEGFHGNRRKLETGG